MKYIESYDEFGVDESFATIRDGIKRMFRKLFFRKEHSDKVDDYGFSKELLAKETPKQKMMRSILYKGYEMKRNKIKGVDVDDYGFSKEELEKDTPKERLLRAEVYKEYSKNNKNLL